MRRLAAALMLVVGSGCNGAAASKGDRVFSAEWQNDDGKSIAAVYQRVQAAPVAPGPGVAVGVSASGLVGMGLDGSGKWTHSGKVDAMPVISGEVVVGSSGSRIFALDAKSGKQLWQVDSEGRSLRGAGDDGKVTALSLGNPGGGGSQLLAVSRDGKVLLRRAPQPEIGSPAVQGDVLFVPWGNQYVSAVDLASGEEVGRLLLREQVSHALNIGGALYFGQTSLVRFDQQVGGAARGSATRVTLPTRELPGKPVWFGEGSEVQAPVASARERIRLYALPEGGQVAGGRFAATYFRVVMGLGAQDGKLAWVRTLPSDVLGGAGASGGFAFCTASGKVVLFDVAGGEAGFAELGTELRGCVVRSGSFNVPAGKAPPALAKQIGEAIEVREAQMVVAQRFLLRELGAIEDPYVTKVLIDLAEDARTPPALLEEGRTLLASRRSGADYMIEALAKHYDFLSDVLRPPPVGPIADALAAMNDPRAAPLLAKHLNDPANTADDIERAAGALEKLATSKQLDELKTFFALYRATADDEKLVNAVLSVARALVRVGGQDAKDAVANAAADPLTHPDIKAGLANLVAKPAKVEPAAKG